MPRLPPRIGVPAPLRVGVGAVLALALTAAGLAAAEPLVLKYVFDRVTGDRSMRAIGIGIVGLLGLGTLREVLGALQNWLTWKTRIDLQFSLTERPSRSSSSSR